MWEKRSYQSKKSPLRPKIEWGRGLEWEKGVWGGKEIETLESDREKWEKNIALRYIYIYIYINRKHDSRWIEQCRDLNFANRAIKELLIGVHSKVTSMDREAIEHLSSIQKLSQWIKKLSSSYWDRFLKTSVDWNCDNNCWEKKIKILIDNLAVKRYREAVRIAQKQFFKEEKNAYMNAIKHATQPKIQTTF